MIATDELWGLESLGWGRRSAAVRPRPFEITLEENETWSFEARGPEVKLACSAGELWITVEGDPEDHILSTGATFSTGRRGRVAVMALCPSRLGVCLAPLRPRSR